MKNVNSLTTFMEVRNENYVLALTPDEFNCIRQALNEYTVCLKDEIDTFEWLNTKQEHDRLKFIEKLVDELYNIPF